MTKFTFHKRNQARLYTFFAIIGCVLSVLVVPEFGVGIEAHTLLLIVTIASSVSLIFSIRRANMEFREIVVEKDIVTFKFRNFKKKLLKISKNDLEIDSNEDLDHLVFKKRVDESIIGKALKKEIVDSVNWDNLLNYFIEVSI